MRRTKIVCTIGPASQSPKVLRKLIRAGMDAARLNFSHGDHNWHAGIIKEIRQLSAELGKTVALIGDLQGPKIRVGEIADGTISLKSGQDFTLTTQQILGNQEKASISFSALPKYVKKGDAILLDDGLLELKVIEAKAEEVECKVVVGGELSSHKGVNLPDVPVKDLSILTEKDHGDLEFIIEQELDWLALSFVRDALDILYVRKVMEEHNANLPIIAKIEKHEAVKNIDEIIYTADGIMVARGDLGVEIPIDEVPIVQKIVVEKCRRAGKPVIVATEMLESMARNPRPTRAEVTDVANAIFDGTDAIMLSEETAQGHYPVEAVKMMAKIAARAESSLRYRELLAKKAERISPTTTDAVGYAACEIAQTLNVAAIITSTSSGYTAQMISKYRPQVPIIAITPNPRVQKCLAISWGVHPMLTGGIKTTDEMLAASIEGALNSGLAKDGEVVLITAGVPPGVSGTTNLIKVHTIAQMLARGISLSKNEPVTARACVAKDAQEANDHLRPGDILVVKATDEKYLPAIKRSAAIVAEAGGYHSHAALAALELHIPAVINVKDACKILKDDMIITLDFQRGLIYQGTAKVM